MNEPSSNSENQSTGHEPNVVSGRLLIISGAGLAILIALSLLLTAGAGRFLSSRWEAGSSERDSALKAERTKSGPQVTASQPQILKELRETETERLSSYAWVDEQAGIARIPIDRAMEILAKDGIPVPEMKEEKADENSSE